MFKKLTFPIRAYSQVKYTQLYTGGKTKTQFLQRAIERSTPSNARLLAELFGGLELGLDLGADGAQAIISVGGAATRCQHQSPCFDMTCNLCYDPLIRIHGKCGGASYFTCRGTLPNACLPYTCTTGVSAKRVLLEFVKMRFYKIIPIHVIFELDVNIVNFFPELTEW